VNAPVLRTARLVLRPHRLSDVEASVALWGDPEVVRHITGRASTPQGLWFRVLRYAGHWALLGFGYWAVEEAESGAFVGEVGFADYRREIDPPLGGAPELGYAFVRRAHGKGYATEACSAAVNWARAHFPTGTRFACIVAPENVPSIRVAEKCGFTLVCETTYNGDPALIYERH